MGAIDSILSAVLGGGVDEYGTIERTYTPYQTMTTGKVARIISDGTANNFPKGVFGASTPMQVNSQAITVFCSEPIGTTQQFVIYSSGGAMYAVVGTISGGNFVFGTPVQFYNATSLAYKGDVTTRFMQEDLIKISDTQFAWAFATSSSTIMVVAFSVSGSTITAGSPVQVISDLDSSGNGDFYWSFCKSSNTVFALVYANYGTGGYGNSVKSLPVYLSGTTVTTGAVATIYTAPANPYYVTHVSACSVGSQIVLMYKAYITNTGQLYTCKFHVITFSGNTQSVSAASSVTPPTSQYNSTYSRIQIAAINNSAFAILSIGYSPGVAEYYTEFGTYTCISGTIAQTTANGANWPSIGGVHGPTSSGQIGHLVGIPGNRWFVTCYVKENSAYSMYTGALDSNNTQVATATVTSPNGILPNIAWSSDGAKLYFGTATAIYIYTSSLGNVTPANNKFSADSATYNDGALICTNNDLSIAIIGTIGTVADTIVVTLSEFNASKTDNILGIISDGANGIVTLKGLVSSLSGLVPGKYYAYDVNGNLTTTGTAGSLFAISDTELLISDFLF